MTFELSSPAFPNNGTIPKKYTCDGSDLSVPLAWTEPPEGTEAFALIADDPDAPAGTWVHWVLYDLPSGTRKLDEGLSASEILDDGSRQGTNDFRKIGYGGPCPPHGPAHHYFFKLYALNARTELPPGASRKQLLHAVEKHTLAQAQLIGTYGRAR